jgi:Ca2+-binding EF-hand superfamily protein
VPSARAIVAVALAHARVCASCGAQPREIKLLLGDGGTFTKDKLRALLANNEMGGYDPIKEAFKVYDPNETGFADVGTLRSIFGSLGYGEIDDDDLNVLVCAAQHACCARAPPVNLTGESARRLRAQIETADGDRDGKISLEDFRKMMSGSRAQQPSAEGAPAPAS